MIGIFIDGDVIRVLIPALHIAYVVRAEAIGGVAIAPGVAILRTTNTEDVHKHEMQRESGRRVADANSADQTSKTAQRKYPMRGQDF